MKREDLFVNTKVWIDETEDCAAALDRSLKRLGLEYVDSYLVHWPIAARKIKEASKNEKAQFERINIPVHKVWPQMEALLDAGLTKSIGVSNFNV